MNNIFEIIKQKIDLDSCVQPILFLGNDEYKLNLEIDNLINSLLSFYKVDKNSVFRLKTDQESIKISYLREFISKSNIKPNFLFQIFLIEDISKFTLESANLILKFLEEPQKGNIIFLTSKSESGIIDTILSRVMIVNIFGDSKIEIDEFYFKLINDFILKNNLDLIKYFFNSKKLEKIDYIRFFLTFLQYIKTNSHLNYLASDIEESINLISKNNVLPKYEIDKLLLKLNYEKIQ